jgi:hypothetical protein
VRSRPSLARDLELKEEIKATSYAFAGPERSSPGGWTSRCMRVSPCSLVWWPIRSRRTGFIDGRALGGTAFVVGAVHTST